MSQSNSQKRYKEITDLFARLEEKLSNKIKNAKTNNSKSTVKESPQYSNQKIDICKQIASDNISLKEYFHRLKSPRILIGKLLNKIRGKFYKEVDTHIEEIINRQELFNKHILEYVEELEKKLEYYEQTNNKALTSNKEKSKTTEKQD